MNGVRNRVIAGAVSVWRSSCPVVGVALAAAAVVAAACLRCDCTATAPLARAVGAEPSPARRVAKRSQRSRQGKTHAGLSRAAYASELGALQSVAKPSERQADSALGPRGGEPAVSRKVKRSAALLAGLAEALAQDLAGLPPASSRRSVVAIRLRRVNSRLRQLVESVGESQTQSFR